MTDELNQRIWESIGSFPEVEGPIPVTETSHPFSSMAYVREPLDLESFGYVEEEYFLSGSANVYEEAGESMKVKHQGSPYKNRILVRKPADSSRFSGRVFVDIYNASNGYDIEDVWRRSYQYYLEKGDIYIGITSKPINVWSLKNFDYDRYHTLDWSAAYPAPQPATVNQNMSIPGTEEGLFWDMLSQLAWLIRSGESSFLKGYSVNHLYLTGQSQSGMYLNTYVSHFHPYLKTPDGTSLFDGYLNVVGAGVMRSLSQSPEETEMFSARPARIGKVDVPFITLTAHGDFELFSQLGEVASGLEDSSTPDKKIRLYEVASAPHTDPASPLIPDNSEIVKTKQPPKILDGEYHYTVNDIQLAYYVNSALEWLHQWAANDVVPPPGKRIEKDESGTVVVDIHGNAVGGLRSPYVDVPVATYHPNARANPDEINQAVGNVNGSMDFFSQDKFEQLYGTAENYVTQFNQAVDEQVEDTFLLPSDAERMKQWAKRVAEERYNIRRGVESHGPAS